MKKFNIFCVGLISAFAALPIHAQITTFDYTGAMEAYAVPAGVTQIRITALGAQGGSTGGLGASMEGTFAVTPGEVLNVLVGEEGHLQVGGNFQNSAGGGGGSFVYTDALELLIAAGGGGGKCPYTGAVPLHPECHGQVGEGGGANSDYTSVGGAGGNGGAAGLWGATVCGGGGTGWLSVGGGALMGGSNHPSWTGGDPYCAGGGGGCGGLGGFGGGGGAGNLYGGGGGGGGYSGGAGGNDPDHGGGGGSFNAGTDQVNEGAVNTGNGQVIIEILCSGITVTVSDDVVCLGDSFTLEGSGLGIISWDGGVENGVPFTPATAGIFTYTASSTDGEDCGYSLDIEVIALPTVVATADETAICLGESVIFSGDGADTYSWDMGVTDGLAFEPGVGAAVYTVTGTDAATGCENSDEIEVVVNDLPEVLATATDNEICLGESITLNGDGATSYVWTPAGTIDGEEFTPDATGTTTYEVTGTDDNGCVNTATTDVTVYDAITITYTTVDEMMGADGSIDITVTGGNPAYSFDWDTDGTGDFDDTEDLTGLAGGTYIVAIEDEAGCSATETIVLNSQLGIEINAENSISIYPNPTASHITILVKGSFTYEITSVNGAVLMHASGVDTAEVSLEELASGIYFVNLTIDGELTTVRVVKN